MLRAFLLQQLDGRPYPAYRDLVDTPWVLEWPAGRLTLHVLQAQGDPFAPPSRLAVVLEPAVLQRPPDLYATDLARRAAADCLHRALHAAIDPHCGLALTPPVQEVLARTAVRLSPEGELTLLLCASLPAASRRSRVRDGRRLSAARRHPSGQAPVH